MIVEPDGHGGWFIQGVDALNASIHLTKTWLDEFEHHQGPQPQLRWLLDRQSTADDIAREVRSVVQNRQQTIRGRQPRSPELKTWREQRANRNRTRPT